MPMMFSQPSMTMNNHNIISSNIAPPPLPPLPISQPGSGMDEELSMTGTEKALKIMEKSGWKVGKGIGRDEKGMITPLIAVKTTSNTAVIKNSVLELGDVLDPVIKEKMLEKEYLDAYFIKKFW